MSTTEVLQAPEQVVSENKKDIVSENTSISHATFFVEPQSYITSSLPKNPTEQKIAKIMKKYITKKVFF